MTEQPKCQHCEGAVRWGQTEHGYAGFVHEASGNADCAKGRQAVYGLAVAR